MVAVCSREQYIRSFKESRRGDLETFKENKESYSPDMVEHTFVCAIRKNNLNCVKYMIENNIIDVIDRPYCDIAVKHSAFDCLKYLHEQGCPFRKYTALVCLIRDDTKSLHYILQNGGKLIMPPE